MMLETIFIVSSCLLIFWLGLGAGVLCHLYYTKRKKKDAQPMPPDFVEFMKALANMSDDDECETEEEDYEEITITAKDTQEAETLFAVMEKATEVKDRLASAENGLGETVLQGGSINTMALPVLDMLATYDHNLNAEISQRLSAISRAGFRELERLANEKGLSIMCRTDKFGRRVYALRGDDAETI